jgi:hypothetical protein
MSAPIFLDSRRKGSYSPGSAGLVAGNLAGGSDIPPPTLALRFIARSLVIDGRRDGGCESVE